MYKIQTRNAISDVIYKHLNQEKYFIGSDIKEPHAILVRSADLIQEAFSDELLAIGRAGAGVNNIPVDKCTNQGIVVFNTPGANANAVSELVMTGMLLLSRNIIGGIQWVNQFEQASKLPLEKAVEKEKGRFSGSELRGKTLGIIGLGAIGTLVANNAANGFGMKVLGFDPFMSLESAWALSRNVISAGSMDELLAEADYLSIHVPLTSSTTQMVDAAFIGKMKKGACLLNFSRGELVDNEVCISAVESGLLGGYVTDFPVEKLKNHNNIICIPHLGASTIESEENCASMAAEEIKNYLEFGTIRNSVNMPEILLGPVQRCRILVIHDNVPNMVSNISAVISKEKLNIDNMLNRSKDKIAVTVLELDHSPSDNLLKLLVHLQNVHRVRIWY